MSKLSRNKVLTRMRRARSRRRYASPRVLFATNSFGALLYEIPRVLFDIDVWYASDQSHIADFSGLYERDLVEVNARAMAAWGITIPHDERRQYFKDIAKQITSRRVAER